MNEMKEAVGNWREAKQFSPADENDFLRWLDKADTEEKLFSRLTFWFTFRGLPADQNQRYAHTELAPTSQALAKRITELEPMLWERDAVKYWRNRRENGGMRHCFKQERLDNTNTCCSEQITVKT